MYNCGYWKREVLRVETLFFVLEPTVCSAVFVTEAIATF